MSTWLEQTRANLTVELIRAKGSNVTVNPQVIVDTVNILMKGIVEEEDRTRNPAIVA